MSDSHSVGQINQQIRICNESLDNMQNAVEETVDELEFSHLRMVCNAKDLTKDEVKGLLETLDELEKKSKHIQECMCSRTSHWIDQARIELLQDDSRRDPPGRSRDSGIASAISLSQAGIPVTQPANQEKTEETDNSACTVLKAKDGADVQDKDSTNCE